MPERHPIAFLPGIMGSRLHFPNSNLNWDPDSAWQMYFWLPLVFRSDDDNRRALHAREPAHVLTTPLDNSVDDDGVAHGWGGVVWSYYGTYLQHLRTLALDGRAFAVGYDWRQDIEWLGEFVAAQLEACLEETGADKVNVATHSMGGLVLRAACLHRPALVARLGRVVFVCPPSVGGVVLYRRLFTGLIPDLDGGGSLADRAFRILLGTSRAGFVGNMSGLPGAMELLPSEHFPSDNGDFWHSDLTGGLAHADLYANEASPPGLFDATLRLPVQAHADLRERLLDVREFHAWLGSPTRTDVDHPDRRLIYGTGRATETGVVTVGAPNTWARRTPTGDGTVPEVSARSLNLAQMEGVDEMEHSMACTLEAVRNFTTTAFS